VGPSVFGGEVGEEDKVIQSDVLDGRFTIFRNMDPRWLEYRVHFHPERGPHRSTTYCKFDRRLNVIQIVGKSTIAFKSSLLNLQRPSCQLPLFRNIRSHRHQTDTGQVRCERLALVVLVVGWSRKRRSKSSRKHPTPPSTTHRPGPVTFMSRFDPKQNRHWPKSNHEINSEYSQCYCSQISRTCQGAQSVVLRRVG